MTPRSHRERLIALLTDLPRHLSGLVPGKPIDDMAAAIQAKRLAIDLLLGPMRFCVVHSATPPLDAVATVECILGPLPVQDVALVYRQLLKINQRWAAVQPAGFGIDRQRSALVFSRQLDIANADTQHLVALMQGGAGLALLGGVGGLLKPPGHATRVQPQNHGALVRA